MVRRSGRRSANIAPYSRNGQNIRGYSRGPSTGVYVDTDFRSKAKFKEGQLDGRNEISGYGDRTAVRRDSKGRILGRVKQFPMKNGKPVIPKTVKVYTSHGVKELKVRQVRAK